MKVLLVSGVTGGGAGVACFRLHTALIKSGIDSRILFLEMRGINLPNAYPLYRTNISLCFHKAINRAYADKRRKLKGLPKGTETFYFPTSGFDLSAHPLFKWADVVNLHYVSNILDYPSFFRRNTKPICWTIHDMEPFSGGYSYLKYFPMDQYQKHIDENEKLKIMSLENTELQIVSPSKWLFNESIQSKVFGRFPHQLIPYGLDNTNTFRPHEKREARRLLQLPQDKRIVFFSASSINNRRKGFDLLLAALPEIKSLNCYLAIVGKGEISVAAEAMGIKCFGVVDSTEKLSQLYSASDVYVIPSIDDNLPNTVLESLSCGTPVVGFKIGGIPDMVIPGFNGEIAGSVSSEALAQTIDRCLGSAYDHSRIVDDAKLRFNEKRQADDYISLYEQIIDLQRN